MFGPTFVAVKLLLLSVNLVGQHYSAFVEGGRSCLDSQPHSRRDATSVSNEDILLVFHRPAEPVFTLRGVRRDAAFDVPNEYLPEHFRSKAAVIKRTVRGQPGVRLIRVPLLSMPAQTFADVPSVLAYRGQYSRSNPLLLNLAVRFEAFFTNSSGSGELLARGVWALLHFNPAMVLDGLRSTLVRRPGALDGVKMLELTQYHPETFLDDVFFARARREMFLLPENERRPIPVIRNETQTGTVESRLWYWLEDTHRSVAHWRWHMAYPTCCDTRAYSDRHGEIFAYFHRQMTSRYNAERITNGGSRVQALRYWEPLKESHFPKMFNIMRSKGYLGRQANTSLLGASSSLRNFDTWTERYRRALRQGFLTTAAGRKIPLTGIDGLNRIANELESNGLAAVNPNFYGSLHNALHGLMATAHDTIGVDKEEDTSVNVAIGPVITDPVFYQLHQLLDDLYEEYRTQYLKPYTKAQLSWPGISVKSLSVTSLKTGAINELRTHWQESDLDVSLGLDYTPPGRLYGRFRHLQNDVFRYDIKIENKGSSQRAFIRIFLLIERDEAGRPLDLRAQQKNAIEMDRFDAMLSPGINHVTRLSTASALTVNVDTIYGQQRGASQLRRSNQCRCGWPQSLLVPRGTAKGTPYKLFVMVTDYAKDKAASSPYEICHDGWILCGVPGGVKYPDKKPMGYPFDRRYRADVKNLHAFLTSNMAVQRVIVKFNNSRVDPPGPLLPGGASTTWMPS